jgi:hypothetical protein
MVGTRQGQLRAEYAAWYPTFPVNIWTPAITLARKVARQLLGNPRGDRWAHSPRWEPGPRLLDDRHFFFRGGRSSRPDGDHRRAGDRELPNAG